MSAVREIWFQKIGQNLISYFLTLVSITLLPIPPQSSVQMVSSELVFELNEGMCLDGVLGEMRAFIPRVQV